MKAEEFQRLSLGQISAATGVHRSQLCRYFRGQVAINERTLRKMADALGMSPLDVLRGIQLQRELRNIAS